MCDEGRYGWKHVHDPGRLTQPRKRDGEKHVNLDWSQVVPELATRLKKAGRLAVVVSPHLTVEEAYLLCKFIRGLDPKATLAVGPIPTAGADERFPTGFTIRAEKCPNRKGVEAVVSRLGGGLVNWGDFLGQVVSSPFGAVWLTGGYHTPWNDAEVTAKFDGTPLVIVQDCFASPLWDRADYQLPGATFAERSGSYVNATDRLQSFDWAVRPPAGVMVEGRLYWQLLGREGMYRAADVLAEIAREMIYFSAAAKGVPDVGIDLKINQLA
jgi:NADH-quinone oxidoreductase subunit G